MVKPHIYFHKGYWRCTPWDRKVKTLPQYREAHAWIWERHHGQSNQETSKAIG